MLRIFLVEDDEAIARNLIRLLSAEGFNVTHALTRGEAGFGSAQSVTEGTWGCGSGDSVEERRRRCPQD